MRKTPVEPSALPPYLEPPVVAYGSRLFLLPQVTTPLVFIISCFKKESHRPLSTDYCLDLLGFESYVNVRLYIFFCVLLLCSTLGFQDDVVCSYGLFIAAAM